MIIQKTHPRIERCQIKRVGRLSTFLFIIIPRKEFGKVLVLT